MKLGCVLLLSGVGLASGCCTTDMDCVEKMSPAEVEYNNLFGKTLECDQGCPGLMNCNMFGLCEQCRGCFETCEGAARYMEETSAPAEFITFCSGLGISDVSECDGDGAAGEGSGSGSASSGGMGSASASGMESAAEDVTADSASGAGSGSGSASSGGMGSASGSGMDSAAEDVTAGSASGAGSGSGSMSSGGTGSASGSGMDSGSGDVTAGSASGAGSGSGSASSGATGSASGSGMDSAAEDVTADYASGAGSGSGSMSSGGMATASGSGEASRVAEIEGCDCGSAELEPSFAAYFCENQKSMYCDLECVDGADPADFLFPSMGGLWCQPEGWVGCRMCKFDCSEYAGEDCVPCPAGLKNWC